MPDRGKARVISILYGMKKPGSAEGAPAVGYEVEILTPENMKGQRKNIPLEPGGLDYAPSFGPDDEVTWGTFL